MNKMDNDERNGEMIIVNVVIGSRRRNLVL